MQFTFSRKLSSLLVAGVFFRSGGFLLLLLNVQGQSRVGKGTSVQSALMVDSPGEIGE